MNNVQMYRQFVSANVCPVPDKPDYGMRSSIPLSLVAWIRPSLLLSSSFPQKQRRLCEIITISLANSDKRDDEAYSRLKCENIPGLIRLRMVQF